MGFVLRIGYNCLVLLNNDVIFLSIKICAKGRITLALLRHLSEVAPRFTHNTLHSRRLLLGDLSALAPHDVAASRHTPFYGTR
jgi:hypothetical protein